jgi:hypothetical protein
MPFTYSVVALPQSLAASAPFHVSLFVAPRLTPDGKLGAFGAMSRWADALSDPATKITLADQNGPYAITPLLGLDARVWAAVFPPETPVRAWASKSLNGRKLHSFPADSGPKLAKVIHNSAFGGSPMDLPSPAEDPIAAVMDGFAKQIGAYRETKDGMVYDESIATQLLDRAMSVATSTVGSVRQGEDVHAALVDLHRARRFFEREESVQKYERKPVRKSERLPVPERDFHERLTLLGDQPALLRRLGIIIDVRVTDLARLRTARWLTASIALKSGDFTLPTRVRCQAFRDVLVTVGRDGGDWIDGALKIGDTKRYKVLDLDPDASALKLDRYLWTAPRLVAQHEKGEPTTAAPPTLKGHGFGVARTAHAGELAKRQTEAATKTEPELIAAKAPLLHTEDVARGLRIEVWDDTASGWFSLHSRIREVKVEGLEAFTVQEEGWIQSGAVQETLAPAVPNPNPTVYVHEQLFGWSGWSLSAPHPALPIEHTYAGDADASDPERNERVGERAEPEDPQLHVVTRSRVVKGSLPWLRYGRSYALRAWVADLAGGSPQHAIGKPPAPAPQPLVDAVTAKLAVPAAPRDAALDGLVQTMRAAANAGRQLASASATLGRSAIVLPAALDAALAPGDDDVRRLVLATIDQRQRGRGASAGAGAPRRLAVERAVAPLLAGGGPLVTDPAGWNVRSLAGLAGAADIGVRLPDLVDVIMDTVTALRPLLRWHPVDPPVLVPRAPYTEAESLRHLVVRSGVATTRDPELGDTITVTDIATWVAEASVAHPDVTVDYPDTCERHVAPPKISQFEAEIQGRFDEAMTPGADPAARRRAANVARREAGSFLDTTIPSIDDPAGTTISVIGVRLVDPPGATGPLPTLDALRRGDPLAPGQYVIIDSDGATLPYLPDAMARGVSMVFPDAGHDRPLRVPISIEGTTADYEGLGDWPDVQPFRLVFSPGKPLAGEVDRDTIEMSLPAADMLRVRLSSTIDRERLEQFGFWRGLPEEVRNDRALREAAVDGWLWALCPSEELTFVHAVPKPLEAPRFVKLAPIRAAAATDVTLSGAVDVHGPSSERVYIEATWTQQEDDVVQELPDDVNPPERHAVACTMPILAGEDIALLGAQDTSFTWPGIGPLHVHRAHHEFGDTRHRVVAYRARATTRFREYFHPALLAHVDERSVVGPVSRVSIPSSARPAKPVVLQVLPMFRWEEETEPEQPFGLRRRRRAGVRIYLDRPWYSSGDGELLGVVTGELGDSVPRIDSFSQWGADPVWRGGGPDRRAIGLELDQLNTYFERELPARPVRPPVSLALVDVPTTPSANIVGYRPEFDAARKLWFVDIAIDPGAAIWPFLRLVVARYQPDSLPGLHLSPLVRCDYVQVPLERTATLTRPDDRTVRVVLSGAVGVRDSLIAAQSVFISGSTGFTQASDATTGDGLQALRDAIGANRRAHARLQHQNSDVLTDLGWETVGTVPLRVEGFEPATLTAAWVGSMTLPEAVQARTPETGRSRWRVTIEETEWLDADRLGPPDVGTDPAIAGPPAPVTGRLPRLPRVVYLDHLGL